MNTKSKPLLIMPLALAINTVVIAGTPPIKDLPDYNGSNWGTPNTGGNCDSLDQDCDSLSDRPMFTTLYRDNYYRNQCAGEGCGKHPGVDVDVESGSRVIAPMAGKIHRLEVCNSTWGGLVVIEVSDPYVSGRKAYVSLAHLRAIDAAILKLKVGDSVTEGQVLGESGGGPNDLCRGTSTGSHLHVQVDRQHGGPYPWFPTGRVEDSDDTTAPEVPQKTHNPFPFLTGFAYNSTFHESGNSEMFGKANVTSMGTSDSALWIDSSLSNPQVGRTNDFGYAACSAASKCSRNISLDADIFKRLVINLDLKCINGSPQIMFRKPGTSAWNIGQFPYSGPGKYTLKMSSHTAWYGLVTDFKIQPSKGCTASPGPVEARIHQLYFLP